MKKQYNLNEFPMPVIKTIVIYKHICGQVNTKSSVYNLKLY